jgi:hypothetical protein
MTIDEILDRKWRECVCAERVTLAGLVLGRYLGWSVSLLVGSVSDDDNIMPDDDGSKTERSC